MKNLKRILLFLFSLICFSTNFLCFSMKKTDSESSYELKPDFCDKKEFKKAYTFDLSKYKDSKGAVCHKLRFFAVSNGKKVEVRAVYDSSRCQNIKCKSNVDNLAFNATGTYLGILSKSGLQVWDVFDKSIVPIKEDKKSIYFEFSPCGEYLLYLRKSFGRTTATVLHLRRNKELLTCEVHKDDVNFFCKFVGNYAFFTDEEGNIFIYDLNKKNSLYHIIGCKNLKLNYPSKSYFFAELNNDSFLLGDMHAAAKGQKWLHIFKDCGNVVFSPYFHKPDLPCYKYSAEEKSDDVILKKLDTPTKNKEYKYNECEDMFFDGISGKSFVIMKKDGSVIFKKLNEEDSDGYRYKCEYCDVALSFCGNYSAFLKTDGSILTIDLNNLTICKEKILPNTSVLLRSEEKTILFDLESRKPIFDCKGYYDASFFNLRKFGSKFILFSKEDEETSDEEAPKKELILFDMDNKKVLWNCKDARSFELDESKGTIIFDLNNATKELWSLKDRKRICEFKNCTKLRFGPYGNYVLALLNNRNLELYKKQFSKDSFGKNMNNVRTKHKKYLDCKIVCKNKEKEKGAKKSFLK